MVQDCSPTLRDQPQDRQEAGADNPAVSVATDATAATTTLRLRARTSPIRRMNTSVGMAGGSLAEHEQQTPARGACWEMPEPYLLSRKSVLALDDAGHKKVAILGLAEYGHPVTKAQQLQNRSFNAPQQQCGLIAVSGLDQDGWSGQ